MIFPIRDILRAQVRLRRRISQAGQSPIVYFHSSHTQLDKPERFAWLKRHRMPSVFFIHDVIPIDFPEFCSPGARERHLRRLKTVSELASLLLVNSEYTAAALTRHLCERGWRRPPIGVAPLGVDQWFLDRKALAPPRAKHPYAVCVGTIEPRKNLTFLLAVWCRLVEKLGPTAPRLVIAGRRGWENENIVDVLERSNRLAPYVIEVSDMSDAALASTLAGADMLLAPSSVEGFSLPVSESLALGTPVLASDIDAHREVARGCATLLDPLDGPAWANAIEEHLRKDSPARAQAFACVANYRPITWRNHVETGLAMILKVAGTAA
jgi:glycosyltransferase involved in cell wall biosynthesis